MPRFVRRFRRRAGLLAVLGCALVVVAVVAAAVLTADPDPSASAVAWVVSAGLAIGAAVFAISSVRRSTALREVTAAHPGSLVFLARRQPALVSDLATYLAGTGVAATVADRWVVGMVDARGISAWTVGAGSRELLLMPWTDIGVVEVTRLENGRAGVAVDVKPFATPLVVSVGYSAFGILSPLDRAGVAEIVEGTNAQRPPVE